MKSLLFAAVLVGVLVLFRRRLRLSGLDWRSMIGFVCGVLLGLLWVNAADEDIAPIARLTGVPSFLLRMLLVCLAGLVAARPIREILEDAFPRGRRGGGNDNASRER